MKYLDLKKKKNISWLKNKTKQNNNNNNKKGNFPTLQLGIFEQNPHVFDSHSSKNILYSYPTLLFTPSRNEVVKKKTMRFKVEILKTKL